MSKVTQLITSLREMSVDQLQQELLVIRKNQFKLRLKTASDALTQTHLKAEARKTVARIKTLISEKAVQS